MKGIIGITIYIGLIVLLCIAIMFMGAYLGIKDDFDAVQLSVIYGFPAITIAAVLNIWFSHLSLDGEDEETDLTPINHTL